jgi:hypothetical protein
VTRGGASVPAGRATVDPFGMKPLRAGASCYTNFCAFEVGANGRACWSSGMFPSIATFRQVQLLIDRRFCGERPA